MSGLALINKPYEQIIPRIERLALERALGMESGYLLDFSDRSFDDFFFENIRMDSSSHSAIFSGRGTSKAKRMRAFIENAQPHLVAKILRMLWEHREARTPGYSYGIPEIDDDTKKYFFSAVARLEGRSQEIDTTEIEAFEPNETLEELVASIRRDLDAQKPQAALDRLHTYCMKRYASLVRKHGGGECGKNDPLHSRVGKYVKLIQQQHTLTPLSERIIKSSISVFEEMNPVRNDQSLAHDNKDLVKMDEARFIFDSITAFLRFTKAIDGRLFED